MRLQHYILNEESIDIDDIYVKCKPFMKDLLKNYKLHFAYRGYSSGDDVIFRKTRKNRNPKDTYPEIQTLLDKMFMKKFGVKPRSQGVFATPVKNDSGAYGVTYLFFPVGSYKLIWSSEIRDLYGDFIEKWQDIYVDIDDSDGMFEDEWYINYPEEGCWVYDGKRVFDPGESYESDEREEAEDFVIDNLLDDKSTFNTKKLKWTHTYTQAEINKYVKNRKKQEKEKMEEKLWLIIDKYEMGNLSAALKSNCEMMFLCNEYYLINALYEKDVVKEMRKRF
jgi:hypothetical protein